MINKSVTLTNQHKKADNTSKELHTLLRYSFITVVVFIFQSLVLSSHSSLFISVVCNSIFFTIFNVVSLKFVTSCQTNMITTKHNTRIEEDGTMTLLLRLLLYVVQIITLHFDYFRIIQQAFEMFPLI